MPAAPVTAASTVPPLPSCTYGDVRTPLTAYSSWRSVILDTRLALPRSYVPPDLVSTGLAGLNRDQRVRLVAIPDLRAMARAALQAGIRLRVDSGYRSYGEQLTLYRAFVAKLGVTKARLRAARPGHSEHQLGTAIDLGWGTGTYAWAKANSWRFGWIVSYPSARTSVTCYQSEPWHLRYVGRTRAAAIHASGLTLRAWLWLHVPAARG
jgi:D-alanyl-D-alanine carboxypeptidase